MKNYQYRFLIILTILTSIDLLITMIALNLGLAEELNPIGRFFFNFGFFGYVLAFIFCFSFYSLLTFSFAKIKFFQEVQFNYLLYAFIGAYMSVYINNLRIIAMQW